MKRLFLGIAAFALLLVCAGDAAASPHWGVRVGYGGGYYGGGPYWGVSYGTRVGSNGFVSVGYGSGWGGYGYGYGYPAYGYGYPAYGYGYPAYGYGYSPVYYRYSYPAYYATPYYGGYYRYGWGW